MTSEYHRCKISTTQQSFFTQELPFYSWDQLCTVIFFICFLPYLQVPSSLSSRNVVTMVTWRNDFPLLTRADKGWAVKRERSSKKVWYSGLRLYLEMSLVFDFGQGLRCGLSIRHCRCHWIIAAWFVFLHFFLVPLCWYAVSERQVLPFFAGGLVGVDKHLFQRVSFIMYRSNRSFNMPPPGIPRAFDTFAVPGRREFDYKSLPGGGEFDPHALGVGNLNCTLDFM